MKKKSFKCGVEFLKKKHWWEIRLVNGKVRLQNSEECLVFFLFQKIDLMIFVNYVNAGVI